MVRKSILMSIGSIDESSGMIASEDYNAWLRIAQVTDNFLTLDKCLGYYFVHPGGISQKDMHTSTRNACAPFTHLLSAKQIVRLDANIMYMKGRFHFKGGEFLTAGECLRYCIRHGNTAIKLKSTCMLVYLNIVGR